MSGIPSLESVLLAMPATEPAADADDRARTERLVRRLLGEDSADILDALGLTAQPISAEQESLAEKRCSRCREWKPRSGYYPDRRAADGLMSACGACHTAANCARAVQRAAEIGYRNIPGHDRNITWKTAKPGGKGMPCTADAITQRINTYIDLRAECGYTPREAAERMRISMRTARRYERALNDRQESAA